MKNEEMYLGVALLAVASTAMMLAAVGAKTTMGGVEQAVSAPFRDGVYLAKLASQNGEAPHVSASRWSTDAGRDAFIAGYKQSYELSQAQRAVDEALSAPFRDGLFTGKLDAANGNDAHISLARWSRTADRASFAAGYQRAYDVNSARIADQRVREAALVR